MKKIILALLALSALCGAANASTGFQPLMLKSAVSSPATYWNGGIGVFAVSGTFGGSTVTLEFIDPTGTLIVAGTNTTFTSQGAGVFYLPKCSIEAVVTGGTGISVTASVGSVDP